MSEQVWAVVVTFNRRELLRACLAALREQSYPVARILVVDNASTDGTLELVQEESLRGAPAVEHLRLERNLGAAGGFHHGLQRAYEGGCEWVWAMDDDTVPTRDALERLLAAHERFPKGQRPTLLSCHIVWTDGSPHPMNRTWPKEDGSVEQALAAERGLQSIRATTWVGLLVHRTLIARFGLPVAAYELWSDDIEYTARLLRSTFGVLVPDSVALHNTASTQTARDAPPHRLYFHVRNTLWMLTRSDAWSVREKLPQWLSLLLVIQSRLRHSAEKAAVLGAVVRGLRDGLFAWPRAETDQLARSPGRKR